MSSKNRKSSFSGALPKEIFETAKLIAQLKGEDLDAIIARFVTDYVHNNLHLLTDKVKRTMEEKQCLR